MGLPRWLVSFPLDSAGGGVVKAAAVSGTWTQGREEAGGAEGVSLLQLSDLRPGPPLAEPTWSPVGPGWADPPWPHRAGQRGLEMAPGIPAHMSTLE